jgi:hypothetical protein
MTASRRSDLAARLDTVRERIATAAVEAGRTPDDVTLIVVTKTFPASDVRELARLGVRDIGENRHPEAADKAAELSELDLVWHFIGHVQSNKAARIAAYADVVHSVDSAQLARQLGAAAERSERTLTCLVQASLDPSDRRTGRSGVAISAVGEVADAVAATRGLRLGGVMGIAPPGDSAGEAFDRLASCWHALRRDHPTAGVLSAGMSGDFPAAIKAGATHVRVGSAVMGGRPPLG